MGVGGLALEIARFGAPAVTVFTVFEAFLVLLRDRWRRWTTARCKGHVDRPHRRKDHHEMDKLPTTVFPADPNSDPRSWPQLNYDVGFDPAGGWEGGFAFSFGVQEWAGRNVDESRGHLALASWIMADRSLTPVDPVFTREVAGQVIFAHNPTRTYGAREGAVGRRRPRRRVCHERPLGLNHSG